MDDLRIQGLVALVPGASKGNATDGPLPAPLAAIDVNLASMAGVNGTANLAAYVAGKAGIIGLTKVAALDYADKGIRRGAWPDPDPPPRGCRLRGSAAGRAVYADGEDRHRLGGSAGRARALLGAVLVCHWDRGTG